MDFRSIPGWDADPRVASWPGLPPLDGDATADACVVGLGGSGLAAVEELVSRGLSVVGLDAGRVAAGAAGRNGGLLLGGAEPAFHDAVRDWGAEPAAWLYRQTLAELDHLVDVLPGGVVRRAGSLRLVGGVGVDDGERTRELADCAAQAAALRAHGIAVEEASGASGAFGEGLFLPDDAQANPVVRHLGVLAHVQREAGARARLHETTRVERVRPGVVETDRGAVRADVVLVAVDGGLDVVLPRLGGERPRVRTARLQMLATAPLDDDDAARVRERVPCGVYERWGYDYAQLDDGPAGLRLLVGGGRDVDRDAEWTTSTDPTPPVQAHVERVAERLLGRPLRDGEVAHRWGASVGYTAPEAQGRAFCGSVDEGVAAVGGYCGTGNLVGAVAARAAVRLLLDGERPPSCFTSLGAP